MLQQVCRSVLRPVSFRGMATAITDGPVLLSVDADTRVATLTLNKPEVLNALDAEMGDAFVEAVDHLCHNCEDVGAVVLTGAGSRGYSAGGDLAFLKTRHEDTPSRNAVVMRRFYERFLHVRQLPVPVVCAINGHAVGAGAAVAMACDTRQMVRGAKIGFTFVGLGLHPGMGSTYYLPQIVGSAAAAKLLLTGDLIGADEAKSIGLVSDVLDDQDALLESATALAARMAAQSPVAVRACVRSLRLQQDEGLDRALWREADAQSQSYASRDLGEGVDAIREKRKPVFRQYEDFRE